jgi:hypothetical protein
LRPCESGPGPGDPVQRAHHDRDLQGRRPAGSRPASAPGARRRWRWRPRGPSASRSGRDPPRRTAARSGPGTTSRPMGSRSAGLGPAGQQDDRSASRDRPALGRERPRRQSRTTPRSPLPALLRHSQNPGPWAGAAPVTCSTHTTVLRIRRVILSQSVRLSASRKRPPRRSNDGQAILEHPR